MRTATELDRLVRIYKALGDGTRLKLVALLAGLERGDALCVNALVARLDVSQPAVSQHLGVLRAAELVLGERRGYHVHYRLNPAALAAYRRGALAVLGEAFVGPSAEGARSQARVAGRRGRRAERGRKETRVPVVEGSRPAVARQ